MALALSKRTADWKAQSRARLEHAQRLQQQKELEECLFKPQMSARRPPQPPSPPRADAAPHQRAALDEHVARQRKARKQAADTADRGTPAGHNYRGKPTVSAPFRLGAERSTYANAGQTGTARQPHGTRPADVSTPAASGHLVSPDRLAGGEDWRGERRRLLSIIDAQQQQLVQRAQAQSEAVAIAERFAASVLLFEERLQAMEKRTADELRALRAELPSAAKGDATQRAVGECTDGIRRIEAQLAQLATRPDPFDRIQVLEQQLEQADQLLASRTRSPAT
eukprot:g1780.t1